MDYSRTRAQRKLRDTLTTFFIPLAGIAAVGLAVWGLVLPATFAHDPWTYSWDSAAYIEAANNLYEGRGLVHRVIHGLGEEIWEPLTLWPPGYPVLMAVLMPLGMSAAKASVVISVVSGALSIVVLSYIGLRFFDWRIALPLVVTVGVSESFQMISAQSLSDSATYLWCLASVACVLEWMRRDESRARSWLFGAGLFAGAAWATRNAALALAAATCVFLVAHVAWRRPRSVAVDVLVWAAGAAVCAVPLVIRNLLVFGTLNPYKMPASTIPLAENVRAATRVIIGDLTTVHTLGSVLAARVEWLIAAVILLALMATMYVYRRALWLRVIATARRHRALLFVLFYAAIYVVLVIVARTKYQWGEVVSSRYMVQVYWVLWLAGAVAGVALLERTKLGPRARTAAVAAMCFVLAMLHTRDVRWKLTREAPERNVASGRVDLAACEYFAREVRADQIVVAMRADVWRIHCGVNARKLQESGSSDSVRRVHTAEEVARAGQRGLLWGILIEDVAAAKSGRYGTFVQELVAAPERHPDFVRENRLRDGVVLRYTGGLQ